MSLSAYFLEYARHVGQLRRRRRRAYACAPYMSMGFRLAALRAAAEIRYYYMPVSHRSWDLQNSRI